MAALVPALVILPLRWLVSGDESPFTVLLLGPAVEESLKLAALLLALLAAAYLLPRGRDPANALRYWLFLTPWFVGGFYGMIEGFLVYPDQPSIGFTVRELAHGAFVALGLVTALWVWRETDASAAGLALGLGAAWAAHFGFNALALLSDLLGVSFADQAAYALAAAVVAVILLGRAVGREPASRESRALLAVRRGG